MVVMEGTEKHKFGDNVQSGELVKYSINYLNKGNLSQMHGHIFFPSNWIIEVDQKLKKLLSSVDC